jgi:uncharacterized membrane protein
MQPTDDERRAAIHRLKNKQAFRQHVVAYVVVNAFLVAIWAVSGGGYFWPVWVLLGWGVALVFHAWSAYGQRGITEADIQREMGRGGQ